MATDYKQRKMKYAAEGNPLKAKKRGMLGKMLGGAVAGATMGAAAPTIKALKGMGDKMRARGLAVLGELGEPTEGFGAQNAVRRGVGVASSGQPKEQYGITGNKKTIRTDVSTQPGVSTSAYETMGLLKNRRGKLRGGFAATR
jgi:hypothetical protein